MKFNLKKFNSFFDNNSYDNDINEFILAIMENNFREDTSSIMETKYLLLDLDFYEIEQFDIDDEDNLDCYIIDFYKLSQISIKIRDKILIFLLSYTKDGTITDFFYDMATEDLKILIVYEDWKIAKRRNKLDNLNNIKE